MIPKEEIEWLDIKPEEAMKFVLSGEYLVQKQKNNRRLEAFCYFCWSKAVKRLSGSSNGLSSVKFPTMPFTIAAVGLSFLAPFVKCESCLRVHQKYDHWCLADV